MIQPVFIDKRSPFIGEDCALCKAPFAPGDEIVICPEDATRHHVHCWRANHNKCTAYGCTGHGEVEARETTFTPHVLVSSSPDGKVQALPSSSFGCARSCLLISIAISILLFAISCFGLWVIADYIMKQVSGPSYHSPLTGFLPSLLIFVNSARLLLL